MLRSSARRALLSSWLVVLVVLASSIRGGAAATTACSRAKALSASADPRCSLRVVDAVSGAPLSSRARLTPRRMLAESTHHTAEGGRFELTLAAGEYDLVVSHGSEWSLFERTLSLAAGGSTAPTATCR